MADLESIATDIINRLAKNDEPYDEQQWAEEVSTLIHEQAEAACTYHSDVDDILREYENNSAVPAESELGTEFRADQWQEAKTAWACEVVCAVLHSLVQDHLESIEDTINYMIEAAGERGQSIDASDLRVYSECPYGWVAHDREDVNEILHWDNRQVDGMNAIAAQVGDGVAWVAFAWTPETNE